MAADCCSQQDYEKQAGIYRTVMMENIGGNREPQACQKNYCAQSQKSCECQNT